MDMDNMNKYIFHTNIIRLNINAKCPFYVSFKPCDQLPLFIKTQDAKDYVKRELKRYYRVNQ